MRHHAIVLLACGLMVAACQDDGGPLPAPSTVGTLIVSTTSVGNDPDQDGYLLVVDGGGSVRLESTGTYGVDLPAGPHTLRLLDITEYCSVSPGTPLDVAVRSGDTTSVAFEVRCSWTGVRISTATTGLDVDTDGYGIQVDGILRGAVFQNDTVPTRLDPGSRTIGLTGLAPNCAVDGPASHTVTVVEAEVVPIEFAIVCTATSGVIEVVVTGGTTGVIYQATVDGASPFEVGSGAPAYVGGMTAGDHTVSLTAPLNCPIRPAQQSVRVTAGGLVRDTVKVSFSATGCTGSGTIRVGIRSSIYSLFGFTPVELTLDGVLHDLRVSDGETVVLTFEDLLPGTHYLQAQFTYDGREWIRCHSTESLRASTQPVTVVGAETGVDLEIVTTEHCHWVRR